MVKSFLLALLTVVAFAVLWSPARGAELLANGGFEEGSAGWAATFGVLEGVGAPVRSGAQSARLTSSALQSHDVYQSAAVASEGTYAFGGWIRTADSNVDRVFLRISWFDAAGSPISSEDSSWLTTPADEYRWLSIGPVSSPIWAARARVGVRVQATGAFSLYLDDFSFTGALPPPETPSPSPSHPPPILPTTPAPSARPATPTPALSSSTPTPVSEPEVFDGLTNGSFEQARSDGTPYGWRDVGAELVTVSAPKIEGNAALALTSRTASTKWAFQTVAIAPAAWYEAAAWSLAGGAESAFVRVSWYSTPDGSGPALDSVDSERVASPESAGFLQLTTGSVQAPPNALSAKVRLMVRPGSDNTVSAFFDAVSLDRVDAPAGNDADRRSAATGSRFGGASIAGPVASGPEESGPEGDADTVGATPFVFANVQTLQAPRAAAVPGSDAGYQWLAYVGIVAGASAIAWYVYTEVHRSKRGGAE